MVVAQAEFSYGAVTPAPADVASRVETPRSSAQSVGDDGDMPAAGFRAVLLDWRGTLAVGLDDRRWAHDALVLAGRDPAEAGALVEVLAPLADALDGPGVDSDAGLHARTHQEVLTGAGLDEDLVNALYAVESDVGRNPFALDVAPTLAALREADVAIGVVSDIHVDLRPVFVAAGLDALVSVYSLSFELGAQKPDPAVFTRTLDALGVRAEDALMVGDRSRPDGGAVEVGITTLLLPLLRSVQDRRLHTVLRLCGISAS